MFERSAERGIGERRPDFLSAMGIPPFAQDTAEELADKGAAKGKGNDLPGIGGFNPQIR